MAHAHFHTVLVVDDDAEVRDAIEMLLTLNGVRTEVARDGREALAALQRGPRPCLIVLDVHMPRMDGVAFRHAQQAEPALRNIPVVVLSALPRLDALTKPLAVAACIEKPIAPEHLLALVDEHCLTGRGRRRG